MASPSGSESKTDWWEDHVHFEKSVFLIKVSEVIQESRIWRDHQAVSRVIRGLGLGLSLIALFSILASRPEADWSHSLSAFTTSPSLFLRSTHFTNVTKVDGTECINYSKLAIEKRKLAIIRDYGVRSMISIPGSLSFAKLVMMSSAPTKSAGDARYASQDPFIQSTLSHIQYRLQSALGVLSTSNAINRKKILSFTFDNA